jgi:O-methyltransferase involved in polyketide biosynthesis
MPEKIHQSLDGVSQTLLMTLYVRARESQRPDAMIKDDQAADMVNKLDCDFSRLRMQRHDEVAVIMRMRKFDSHVRDFLVRNPDGVVVHIGCGLDTRFERVDNGRVEWFDLDMQDVIELRKKLLQTGSSRYHMIPKSVFEFDWIDEVCRLKPRSFLFMAEGVFPYFEESLVKGLFLKLKECFPGAELVCDAHTPFVVWADNIHLALARVKARLHWSIKTGRDPEGWGAGIQMLDEWNYYDENEENLKAFRWVRAFPALAKSSGIFHYQLG